MLPKSAVLQLDDEYLRMIDLKYRYKTGASTIYDWIKKQDYPKTVQAGTEAVALEAERMYRVGRAEQEGCSMKTIATPNPQKFCHHSIDPFCEQLALLLLAARDDFEYLARLLEQGSGREFVEELIKDYRDKARQADYFVDRILAGGAL